MTYKHSRDQSNQSCDLHCCLQNGYDWPTVPLLLMTQRSESVRQTTSCSYIQRCIPTAAQKPAAAEGNTISVRWHIRGVPELTIRHRGYEELGERAHKNTGYTAPTITNPDQKKANYVALFAVVVFLYQFFLLCWRQQRVIQ